MVLDSRTCSILCKKGGDIMNMPANTLLTEKLFAFVEKEIAAGRTTISGEAEKVADGRIKISFKSVDGTYVKLSISKMDIKLEDEVAVAEPKEEEEEAPEGELEGAENESESTY